MNNNHNAERHEKELFQLQLDPSPTRVAARSKPRRPRCAFHSYTLEFLLQIGDLS